MADPFEFEEDTTELTYSNMNLCTVQGSMQNLLRNGSFESWLGEGISNVAPDGWILTGSDGNLDRWSGLDHGRGEGSYGANLSKTSGDSGTEYVWQNLSNLLQYQVRDEWFTFSMRVYASVDNVARIYIQDSSDKTYSSYATNTYTRYHVSKQLSSSTTSVAVGLEAIVPPSNCGIYFDQAMFTRGKVKHGYFVPNPTDLCPIVTGYNDDGTYTHCGGGLRLEPFKKSGTLAGGDTHEDITVTLVRPFNFFLGAWATITSYSGIDHNRILTHCHTFNSGAGTMEVTLWDRDGSNFANAAYQLRGCAIGAGWDDGSEVHGG